MQINIHTFGKNNSSEIEKLCQYYQKLIGKYTRLSITPHKSKDTLKIDSIQFPKANAYNAVLTERGKEYSTLEFSTFLEELANQYQEANFYIANAWGFEEELEEKTNLKLRVSKFTLQHDMVKLILLEQLFRCLNLISGGKYHK
jgi:23S rRNA (pseudouridine1915-N3)-methyltransferase